jgi:hypothetical protein
MKAVFCLALLVSLGLLALAAAPTYAIASFCPATPSISNGTTIATPLPHATVTSPVTVSGTYFGSFEGVVPIQIMRADGSVLAEQNANNECCTLSPYSTGISFSVSAPTPACVVVYRENLSGMGDPLTPLVQVPVTLAPSAAATGSIAGALNYPSDFIPPLRVYAINTSSGQGYYIETMLNQGSFTMIGLPVATYHVLARPRETTALIAGYSNAVPCGLGVECTDHTLIPVTVTAGITTSGANVFDWYAPPGTFPPDPAGSMLLGSRQGYVPLVAR